MSELKIYNRDYLKTLIKLREDEERFGEKVGIVDTLEELKQHPAPFVLLGIPEDVGVKSNYGKPGTDKAWKACLNALVNMQANAFTKAEQIIVLGEINCDEEMQAAKLLDPGASNFSTEIGNLVESIDRTIAPVIQAIISTGKIPVIIGGGHNNALGIVQGAAAATGDSINVINFDAHTDFKPLEHRHSGNPFSYAMDRGYLNKYAIFGIHKSYTSQAIYDRMARHKDRIGFYFFENLQLKQQPPFEQAMKTARDFVRFRKFGLELDVDAIEGFPSSAMTPSGFSMTQARQFVCYFRKNPKPAYYHFCEAVPQNSEFDTVGKALAYLVLDATT